MKYKTITHDHTHGERGECYDAKGNRLATGWLRWRFFASGLCTICTVSTHVLLEKKQFLRRKGNRIYKGFSRWSIGTFQRSHSTLTLCCLQ